MLAGQRFDASSSASLKIWVNQSNVLCETQSVSFLGFCVVVGFYVFFVWLVWCFFKKKKKKKLHKYSFSSQLSPWGIQGVNACIYSNKPANNHCEAGRAVVRLSANMGLKKKLGFEELKGSCTPPLSPRSVGPL